MRILALEPYLGGSHRAFLEGWSSVSRHDWTIIGLPPHQWKWRMRHAPLTLSGLVSERVESGEGWDVLFCSDMLNLAEFKGLVDPSVSQLPTVAYFHENQLTYPVRHEQERDLHFAFTNFTTALTADEVWFNSDFHYQSFRKALYKFLKRMPDYNCRCFVADIKAKSQIQPQGIHPVPRAARDLKRVPLILWAARWEFDKNPELFFEVLNSLLKQGREFRVSVIGEQFDDVPDVFSSAREWLGERVVRWGYQGSREEYETALAEADILVSTADHEFFGVSVVETISAGAFPLLPHRLAYPEVLSSNGGKANGEFFYDGSFEELTAKLGGLLDRAEDGDLWKGNPERASGIVEKYHWDNLAPRLDDGLDLLAEGNDSIK